MAPKILQPTAWQLIRRQYGVISRPQLLALGYSDEAIKHRLARGRLRRVAWGVYAVPAPDLTQHGRWMAAVLSCGAQAALSDYAAAALWGMMPIPSGPIHVTVPRERAVRRPGIVVHRREHFEVTRWDHIPVTTPVCTLIDLAAQVERDDLERAINEADKRDLTDPEELRAVLAVTSPRPGVAALRKALDQRTFVLTDSALERRFRPIARRAGLDRPETGVYLNGFKVDFYWPALGLVVETDGLRYHRTPAQQAKDRVRDHAHAAAGLTSLRFPHAQVAFEPAHVEATLRAVADRLRTSRPRSGNLASTLID